MRLQHLLYIPLALGLFASCKDDRNDVLNNPQPLQPTEQTQDQEGVGVSFTIGGEIEEMQDARSMTYALEDRNVRRGTNNSAWEGEFSPKASLREGKTYSAYLIFMREKDNDSDTPSVFRVYKNFTAVKNAQGELILQFKGNINFPAYLNGKKFADDIAKGLGGENSKWYVMAMLGYTSAEIAGDNDNGYTYHGVNHSNVDYRIGIGHATFSPDLEKGDELNKDLRGVPLVSQWHQVKIGKAIKDGKERISGDALQLHFRPQGTLIQIDFGGDIGEEFHARRFGAISNVLDFSGYYRLENNDLYDRFKERDDKGYGIPLWEADEPHMSGFGIYFTKAGADGLSSGARAYPWHMPTITDSKTPTIGEGNATATKINTEGANLGQAYVTGSWYGSERTTKYTVPNYLTTNSWFFAGVGSGNRRVYLIWGMPKAQKPSNPYTYLWASAYSIWSHNGGTNASQDLYINSFDPSRLTAFSNIISDYRQKIREAEAEKDTKRVNDLLGESVRVPYQTGTFTGNVLGLMQRYTTDSLKYYGEIQPEFIGQQTINTQPLLALYQTNYNNFQERQVYHVQSMIQSDLLITEVKYREENGRNYSAVEVYNPRATHVNLEDYALVRLAPSTSGGNHLDFVKHDGTTTDKLEEAMLLPLIYSSINNKGKVLPTNKFPWLQPLEETIDIHDRFAEPWIESRLVFNTPFISYSTKDYYDNSPLPKYRGDALLSQQTLVIGASGYINELSGGRAPSRPYWVFATQEELIASKTTATLNHIFAYATGDLQVNDYGETIGYEGGVTDYQPGHAFALVKSNGLGGWQIIDATGPVGAKHTAFAGSYEDFKATFAGLQGKEFSVSRSEGVRFPFIAPFRTKRMTNKWSDDWEISEGTPHTLGYRSTRLKRRYLYNLDAYRKRTPLDATWTTYWNGIPSITKDANSTPVKN